MHGDGILALDIGNVDFRVGPDSLRVHRAGR
jgi:hypothetical protein